MCTSRIALTVIIAGHLVTCRSARGADIRDMDQLVFFGVEAFDVAEVRGALEGDFELLLAAHPRNDLLPYLAKLQETVRNGYWRSGFPEAVVNVTRDAAGHRFQVRVQEGPRYRCGDVRVVGARQDLAEQIERALTEDRESSNCFWKRGRPARFDGLTALEVRREVESLFAGGGFFSPEIDIRIERDADAKYAALTVLISDEGPQSVIGKIHVRGSKREWRPDVLKYVDLQSGMPFDNGTTARLKDRLSNSGRYLEVDVFKVKASARHGTNPPVRDLLIQLHDYKDAAPLAKDLPPAEQALLKLRDWITRWGKGETGEDIVVEGTLEKTEIPRELRTWINGHQPAGPAPQNLDLHLRSVISPKHGQTIMVRAAPVKGQPFVDAVYAAFPDRLVVADLQRRAKLVLPKSTEGRLIFNVTGQAAKPRDDEHPFRLSFGMGYKTSKSNPVPFEVQTDFAAVFVTSLAHFPKVRTTVAGGLVRIRDEDYVMEIDPATGRLVEFRWEGAKGGWVTVRAERNVLSAELQRIDAALVGCREAYDPKSPWKSLAEFLVDEWVAVAGQAGSPEGLETLRAVQKTFRRWSPPALMELLEPWDRLGPESDDSFRIPWHFPVHTGNDESPTGTRSSQNYAGRLVLPIYRQFVPRTGWMWPVGRDAALYYVSRTETPAAGLQDAAASGETGPLGKLLISAAELYLGLPAAAAAKAGRAPLGVEAFRVDYEPLLARDSWLGDWLLSLAEALRGLDDAELAALSRFLPEGESREAGAKALRMLKARPREPIEIVLANALDRLWDDVLRDRVAEATAMVSMIAKIRPGKLHKDAQVRPASAKTGK